MIESLRDLVHFRERKRRAWTSNVSYWLTQTLRHVNDVGDEIVQRVQVLCRESTQSPPVVVDMGCGNSWLLKALLERNVTAYYVGVDNSPEFIQYATEKYGHVKNAAFVLADLEGRVALPHKAAVVVNSFNFFELCELNRPMANVAEWLRPDGTLLLSTIDKTYLILAVSRNWDEFHENLKRYEEMPGIKFDFQRVDLGTAVSDSLVYPSVFYNTQDYIEAARSHGMHLVNYAEHRFTAAAVPKIYCHLEFRRRDTGDA